MYSIYKWFSHVGHFRSYSHPEVAQIGGSTLAFRSLCNASLPCMHQVRPSLVLHHQSVHLIRLSFNLSIIYSPTRLIYSLQMYPESCKRHSQHLVCCLFTQHSVVFVSIIVMNREYRSFSKRGADPLAGFMQSNCPYVTFLVMVKLANHRARCTHTYHVRCDAHNLNGRVRYTRVRTWLKLDVMNEGVYTYVRTPGSRQV